jgi:hypothetical protein
MKRHEERFAPDKLDEQLEQLTKKPETGIATPEQHVLQDLLNLHATRAESERRLLERVRLRLNISAATSQSMAEEEEVFPEPFSLPERNAIIFPIVKRRSKKRFGPFLQGLAAVLFVGLLVGSFLMLLSLSHRGIHTSSSFTTNWQVVSSPHLPSQQNHLWGVSASAANDVWAVGESFDGSDRKTLIEHWNGQQWKVVANPNLGSDPTLQGVAAISPDNAWVVGETSPAQSNGITTVLIEHWNGIQWSVAQAPNPGSGGSSLSKVVAIAANNVWAVGTTVDAGVEKALIEHWDGRKWRVVSSPSPTSIPALLTGVTAISANDIWTVGYLMPSQSSRRAFIEHWDGKTWSIIDAPDLKTVDSQLFSVSAVSPDDVWAAGTLENRPAKPLIEHWDGKRWRVSPIPNGLENSFTAVMAITAHDVWAVGSTNETSGQPVIFVHWDGIRWSSVQAATASSQCQNELMDLAVIPQSSRLWAVGDYVASSCSGQSPLLIQPLFEVNTLKRA